VACVYLSLGSNIFREKNIANCLRALRKTFGEIKISNVYESESVGFDGDNFYNLAVELQTEKSVAELSSYFRELENVSGRDRDMPKFSSRTLDIDILTYNDYCGVLDGVSLPRGEILKNAFVLLPLSEIAPDVLHPIKKVSYATLWSEFDREKQKLWVVPFDEYC